MACTKPTSIYPVFCFAPSMTHASVEEDVDGCLGLLRHASLHEDEPHGNQRPDGVADVVAAVGEAAEAGGHDLEGCEQPGDLRRLGARQLAKLLGRLWFREKFRGYMLAL